MKSLKSQLVLQFAIIVLPMMAILLYQTASDIYHSGSLERSYRYLAACHAIKLKYTQFINGAVDAVDTGQLGSDALRALDDAAEKLRNLAREDRTGNFVKLQGETDDLFTALKHDRSINTLILSRASINRIDAELGNEYLRYEKENRRAIEANITFAKIQRKIVSGALIAVFTGLLMAFLISRKIIGSVRASMDFAGRIARGDLSSRMALEGGEEFRALATSLNGMSEALQSARFLEERRAAELEEANEALQNEIAEHRRDEEEIRRLNAELELKVAERTRQLVEAQEQLVHREKLAMLGQLGGSVGNELRNPLGVMSNAVYFLNTVLTDADGTVREYLDIIKDEIDNSQRIISDFLDAASTKPPRTMAAPLHELIRQSIKRCAVPENIQIQAGIPETLPDVLVDPLQIGQVFQNLVTNAVQAMPKGGALRIAARRVRGSRFEVRGSEENVERRTLNAEPDADFVEISVEDTGSGISPENMNRLFQPLFTTKARGIGLGLTVVKNLTEANGGRIKAESRLGEGTTFTLMLPIEAVGA